MSTDLERTPRRRERGNTYGADEDAALRVIYDSADCICPERLTPNLVWWAERLAAYGELELTPDLREQFVCISASTVERWTWYITAVLLPPENTLARPDD